MHQTMLKSCWTERALPKRDRRDHFGEIPVELKLCFTEKCQRSKRPLELLQKISSRNGQMRSRQQRWVLLWNPENLSTENKTSVTEKMNSARLLLFRRPRPLVPRRHSLPCAHPRLFSYSNRRTLWIEDKDFCAIPLFHTTMYHGRFIFQFTSFPPPSTNYFHFTFVVTT